MDQRERADKIEPTLAAEPIENTEASEPTDPTDRIEPAEPMDRIEPDEPIDMIDPLDPMLRMEPADPGERDEPAGICITTFWQARDQLGIAPGDRHRAACQRVSRCNRDEQICRPAGRPPG
jgi:hypothetical protein